MTSLLHWLEKEYQAVEEYNAACRIIDENFRLLDDLGIPEEERNRLKADVLDAMLTRGSAHSTIKRIRSDIKLALSDYLVDAE